MLCGDETLKVVSMTMIYDWPVWEKCLYALSEIVDGIYLSVDAAKSSKAFQIQLREFVKVKRVDVVQHNFEPSIWREYLIRMLDKVHPDLVVSLDQDEIFDPGVLIEMGEFWKSNKRAMMFSYNNCISDDGRPMPVYPSSPHMKVFKWESGLSFVPYKGWAQVTQLAKQKHIVCEKHWMANTKINHYCMFTSAMEKAKRRGDKIFIGISGVHEDGRANKL